MTDSKESISLSNQIWKSFTTLSNDISPDDYHVILFLLSLHTFRIEIGNMNKLIGPVNLLKIYSQTGNFKVITKNKNATLLFNTYNPIVRKIGVENIEIFIESLRLYDIQIISKHYKEIFELLLKKCIKSSTKRSDYSLPIEINLLISKLTTLPLNSVIYNPFAGYASFGLFEGAKNTSLFGDNSSTYLGQEKDPNIWAIGYLRLLAHQSSKKKELEIGDSIDDWNPLKSKFDLVIAAPPLGLKLTPPINGHFGVINNAEQFFIEKGIESLKTNGLLIAVVSNNKLTSTGTEQKLREHIIKNDILEMVIAIPSELLVETNISLSIVVINKNKDTKGKVRMVDARNFINTTKKDKRLDYNALILMIKSNTCNESQIFVTNEEIINNNFYLTPSRYLVLNQVIELDPGYQLIKLGSLAPTVSRNRTDISEYGMWVRIRDLKDDNLKYSLDVKDIENNEIPRNAQKIEESCLLISLRGKNIKPTYFKYEREAIYTSNDIVALKVDEAVIDIEYLINELYSEYFLKRIESYRTGTVIPILKKSDLLNSDVSVPSLEEQKAKIKGVKEAFIQSQKKELELEQELLGFKDESFREFASIKHSFRQYLNALQSNVAGTKKFITNNEGNSISLDMVYSKNLNKTFGEHLSSLEGTIQSMTKMLSSFENTKETSAAATLNLVTLITEAQNRFKNTDIFKFEKVNVDTDSFTMFDNTILEPMVSFNEDDFYRLYSNIVSNAMDHGFKDNTKKYSLRTAISFDDKEKKCVLEVSNNGAPMPNNLTLKHLTTRGEKTTNSKGSGMGGADIKAILNKYNGTLDISNQEEEFFAVTYIIKLPYQFDFTL